MATEAELQALLVSVEEGVKVARRTPERAVHREKGSIIDPEADAEELAGQVIESFRRRLGLPVKLTLGA